MTDPRPTGRRRPGTAGADPLGKRALFSAAPVADRPAGAEIAGPEDGGVGDAGAENGGVGDAGAEDAAPEDAAPENGVGPGRHGSDDPFAPAPVRGRRALFSDAPATGGPPAAGPRPAFTLVCRSCGARTALGLLGVAIRLMPSLWLPGRRWSRLVRCPACARPAWCRLERGA